MSKTYSAGIVTAYGAAKRAGYQGTYEDFCRQQAQYAQNASAVEQAKQTAVSASQSANQAKQDAQTASTTAQQSAQSAQGSAQSAGQSAQDAQTAKNNAQTYAQSASQSAGSAQQSAQSAQTVLESIPEDYSDLSEDVDKLKADLNVVISNGTTTINLNDLEYVQQGIIQGGTGSFVSPSSASHKIVKMDASSLTYIAFRSNTPYTNSVAFGVIKDSSDNVVRVFNFDNTTNKQEYSLTPSDGDILYVSFLNYTTVPNPNYSTFDAKNYPSIIESYAEEIEGLVNPLIDTAISDRLDTVKYYDCVNKPFAFANKKLWFFGDSITYGYIAASGGTPAHQATNQYPKLFSEAVEAQSYVNWGVNGSTLSDTYTTISTHPLSCDFVFIAGGVNDWQTGVSEATLIQTVTNICEHLKNNFNGTVIFITPINESGRVPSVTPLQTLRNVRNVITRIALQYGYSVVQGWTFPFPTEYDDDSYKATMFQDNLHPTELGYSLYAQALKSALC